MGFPISHTEFRVRLVICFVSCLVHFPACGGESVPRQVTLPRPLLGMLARFCFDCHGTDVQEANLRLDTLDRVTPNLVTPNLGKQDSHHMGLALEKVLQVVRSEKMPPEGAVLPSSAERAQIVLWLDTSLNELAQALRQSSPRSRNRRLTVGEYNYTLQALFGVDAEFADLLPPDPISSSGYRNSIARLGLSSLQMEAYLDSARRAVDRYVQSPELDTNTLFYHVEFEELFYATGDRYATRQHAPAPIKAATPLALTQLRNPKSTYVDPLGPQLPGAFSDDESMRAAIPKLNQQYLAIPRRFSIGEMIVRVRAAGTADRNGRFPRMRVEAGITLGDGCSIDKRLLGEVDVTAPLATPADFEFRIRLEDVPTKGPSADQASFDRLSVFDMDQIFISNVTPDRQAIFALGRGGYSDPGHGSRQTARHLENLAAKQVCFLHLDFIEIEMRRGAGTANNRYRWQIPVVNDPRDEVPAATALLAQFMGSAYRRPVHHDELAVKVKLFRQLREQNCSFEQSLRDTLAGVLVSPSFLFLDSIPPDRSNHELGQITPYQLAARLSYLLWMAPPDKMLLDLAADGSLSSPPILRHQIKRLLADPRCLRFTSSFCSQWLRLDKHALVAVDRQRYPTYDDDLASDSIRETLAYFHEVFHSDTSALDLIDSDYAVLNNRLAEHYDVQVATGGDLHRVRLPPDSIRGGLLTQASILTMNSNGVDSHPIRRGVWLLDRLLNDPPPPPPPNVPAIEDADGHTPGLSLKERIALHRKPGACQACHEQIDSWGVPLENFDAIGRWRVQTEFRQAGQTQSRAVDAATVLPNGQSIGNIHEFKRYLRQHEQERFADSLVNHMLTYALGRPTTFMDRPHVGEIRERFQTSDYRLRELLYAIIESPLFQAR